MKQVILLVAIAAIAAAIWLVLEPTFAGSGAAGTERPSASEAAPAPAKLPAATGDLEREQLETEPASPTLMRDNVSPGGGLFGRTVDESGKPVAGATVYLIPSTPTDGLSGRDRPMILAETRSDAQGEFFLPSASRKPSPTAVDPVVDLGVVANGFLRNMVLDAVRNQPPDGLRIVLERGRILTGYVVDESGRPVPGLDLLAHTNRSGIDHVSMSQTMLRANRANMGDRRTAYHQCRARTDAAGAVRFSGLSTYNTQVRSLDPGWVILGDAVVEPGSLDLLWTAAPRLGVRLTVLDERTGKPVDRVRATYFVALTFADGETEEFGQWIGWGKGGSTFALSTEILPQLRNRTVIRAVFFGRARVDEAEVPWRANPIEDDFEAVGVAEVRVEIDPSLTASENAEGDENAKLEPALLDLDVRYTDGTPFNGRLALSWSASAKGLARRGTESLEALSPGRYRANLVAAQIDLVAAEWGASGSLPAWTGTVRCRTDAIEQALVVLPRGAAVTLLRPEDWTGEWFVHASWREPGSAAWQGSWNYSTTEDRLTLRALRSAEWRFRFSLDPDQGPGSLIRTIVVSEGESVTVPG